MVRTKWVLRREDRDEYAIEELGIFNDLESGIIFLRDLLLEEVELLAESQGHYDAWLRKNRYVPRVHPLREYVAEVRREIDQGLDLIRRNNAEDLEWGIWVYSFHSVPFYS